MAISRKEVDLVMSIFVAIFAVFGFWTYSQAVGTTVTACVEGNGDVYIIGQGFRHIKCSPHETLLSWAITGPQGPSATSTQLMGSNFYHLVQGPFTVNKNEVSSFGVGCSTSSDIVISGGPDFLNASGGLIYWDTIQSRPDMVDKSSWLASVKYSGLDLTAQFQINLVCLRLQ